MRRVISISQIVAPIHVESGSWEVWASADVNYDEAKSLLEVKLDSFLRRARDDKRLSTNRLPNAQAVFSTVPFEQGGSVAKKMFEQWVKRLRRTVQPDANSKPRSRSG
jgi:hypothetical protein